MKIYVKAAVRNLNDEPSEVRHDIASNPHTRQADLQQLAQETDPFVLGGLIANPNLPYEIYEQLMQSRFGNVRYGLATSPNTPSDILEQLSLDEDWETRVAVAGNPNTPVDVLIALFGERSSTMGYTLANNPNTPDFILEDIIGLGNDLEDECYTCMAILENPNVTSSVIRKMVMGDDGYDFSRDNGVSEVFELRDAIIQHPKTPEDVRQYVEGLA